VVKNTVQHQAHPPGLELIGENPQILARAKTTVNFIIIGGVIAMTIALEHWSEIDGVCAKVLNMVKPVQHLAQARYWVRTEIISMWRAKRPERVDMIKNAVLMNACQ